MTTQVNQITKRKLIQRGHWDVTDPVGEGTALAIGKSCRQWDFGGDNPTLFFGARSLTHCEARLTADKPVLAAVFIKLPSSRTSGHKRYQVWVGETKVATVQRTDFRDRKFIALTKDGEVWVARTMRDLKIELSVVFS